MIGKGKIEPLIAVFGDNRDPDDLSVNRRQRQFFCNRDYVKFVGLELTAEIDRTYPTRAERDARAILGLSFGGLNSACFGLLAYDDFRGIAMQSPSLLPAHPAVSGWSDNAGRWGKPLRREQPKPGRIASPGATPPLLRQDGLPGVRGTSNGRWHMPCFSNGSSQGGLPWSGVVFY